MSEDTGGWPISGDEHKFIARCLRWAFDGVGEGFCEPEEAFWDYGQATGDEDWESLADRIAAKPLPPPPELG